MSAEAEAVECEVCALPHRIGVERCEDCGHRLGTSPDWDSIRGELSRLRRHAVLGAVAFVAMIALNVLVLGGAGFVIAVAPIGWMVMSFYRSRILSSRLAAAEARGDTARPIRVS